MGKNKNKSKKGAYNKNRSAASDQCGGKLKSPGHKAAPAKNAHQNNGRGHGNNSGNGNGSGSGSSCSVYKRPVRFPGKYPIVDCKDFVYPSNPHYGKIIQAAYEGFALETTDDYGEDLDQQFQAALEALDEQGFYQFDMTQPAGLGTKVARTFVSRCLVGEEGMTYKYLGLRMFSHPWTAGSEGTNDAFVKIGALNEIIRDRSYLLQEKLGRSEKGTCAYNLTLINRCFPEGDMKLKKEPLFEKDGCAVSWHADSSLEHYSSIGIYHYQRHDDIQTKPWKIALRVLPNAEGPQQGKPVADSDKWAPPVAMVMPQQCLYYMLDDFNHHHQHAVLAGGSHRFASTHRVSLREGHSFDYIQERCKHVIQERIMANRKCLRKLLLLMVELEFEWLRQFFIQGETHRRLHTWWHQPIQQLQNFYTQCELRLALMLRSLKAAAAGSFQREQFSSMLSSNMCKKIAKHMGEVDAESYVEAIEQLEEIAKKRAGWDERERDPIYSSMATDLRPIPASPLSCFQPILSLAEELGYKTPTSGAVDGSSHLQFLVDQLRGWKQSFASLAKNGKTLK